MAIVKLEIVVSHVLQYLNEITTAKLLFFEVARFSGLNYFCWNEPLGKT
jgi:hypothetical protein